MTPLADLHALGERLAEATPAAQCELLTAAAEILASDPTAYARVTRYLGAGAYSDAAIALYRVALPECGFQFGLPPPLNGREQDRAVATSWRRGDASAMPYLASTPALALLRAVIEESVRRRELDNLETCAACRGVGWYVIADGRRQMCRHGGTSA